MGCHDREEDTSTDCGCAEAVDTLPKFHLVLDRDHSKCLVVMDGKKLNGVQFVDVAMSADGAPVHPMVFLEFAADRVEITGEAESERDREVVLSHAITEPGPDEREEWAAERERIVEKAFEWSQKWLAANEELKRLQEKLRIITDAVSNTEGQ